MNPTMKIATLRPGLLVALSSTIRGNVSYRTIDLDPDHLTSEGTREARWETQRRIEDPAEHEEAIKVRSKCRSLITGVCSGSDFGLLCPEANAPALAAAVQEAKGLAAAFNATARRTEVSVYVITGRIAADDVEAVRAINSEIRTLLETMARGVSSLDVKAIRDAANRARDLGAMLTPEAASRVEMAIAQAREAARKIARAGDQSAAEVSTLSLDRIESARLSFLDVDPAGEVQAPEVEGRSLDLVPATSQVAPLAPPCGADATPTLDLTPADEIASPAVPAALLEV